MHTRQNLPALAASLVALAAALSPTTGCELAGVMTATYYKTGSHDVPAQYEDLKGKSVAVLVAVDRAVSVNFLQLQPQVAAAVASQLAGNAETREFIAPRTVLEFQYDHPAWPAMPYDEIGAALGVERLVVVDIYEFRLHEPGNPYVWDGKAAASVGVVEVDGAFPSEFSFNADVAVPFPDGSGFGPTDYSAQQVATVLTGRLVDRVSWLFYEHEEKNVPDY